jgi:Coenzyme PQQ synthesis protein D (PqqD)
VIDETFDGEAVVVHLGTGRYYALNAAATEVWELVRDGRTSSQLRDLVSAGRDDEAAARAVEFLQTLLDERLLVSENGASAPLSRNGGPPRAPDPRTEAWAEPPALQAFEDLEDLLLVDPIHDVTLGPDGWPVEAET